MQTRDRGKQSKEGEGEEKRDQDLENIAGNLLIAEYQVDKLLTRLADLVDGSRSEMSNSKASTHVFKHNDKWYKLSLKLS
jgi:hypothetical protein